MSAAALAALAPVREKDRLRLRRAVLKALRPTTTQPRKPPSPNSTVQLATQQRRLAHANGKLRTSLNSLDRMIHALLTSVANSGAQHDSSVVSPNSSSVISTKTRDLADDAVIESAAR